MFGYCVSYKHTTLISTQVPYTSNCRVAPQRGRGAEKERRKEAGVRVLGLLWREPLAGMPSPGPGSSETLHGSGRNTSPRKEHISTLGLFMSQTYLVPACLAALSPVYPRRASSILRGKPQTRFLAQALGIDRLKDDSRANKITLIFNFTSIDQLPRCPITRHTCSPCPTLKSSMLRPS